MYFMLGHIAFEPINLTDFSENHSAEYAEHQVLKGKPKLQAMGEKLIEYSFAIRLHHKIGGVESRYQALLKAQSKQEALALIWGRGKYKGNFVITDISSTTLFTDAQGNVLAREMNISLKEFVGDIEDGLLGAALNLGGSSLLGSILPAGAVNALSTVKAAVSRAVELYNNGKRVVDDVRNTVALVRQLANDPTSALAYLPSTLANLDNSLGSFSELTGLSETLSGMRSVLPALGEFVQETGSIYRDLQYMKDCFRNGAEGANWNDWFTPANSALADIDETFDVLAPKVAEMTAWIVLRADETEADNGTDIA